jgi:hypothetical protein
MVIRVIAASRNHCQVFMPTMSEIWCRDVQTVHYVDGIAVASGFSSEFRCLTFGPVLWSAPRFALLCGRSGRTLEDS